MAEPVAIQKNLKALRSTISEFAPDPEIVTLVGVTKKFPAATVAEAVALGLTDVGENYAQELVAKVDDLSSSTKRQPNWHFIGGLQRNKVKKLAPHVHLWHTVDRSVLATEIARHSPGARILVQVNTTGEPQKAGCLPNDAERLVEFGRNVGLDVAGLMTLGPSGGSSPEPHFWALRDLAAACEVRELSMGMSADLELALAAGATIVRVGTALFGPRSSR